MSLHLAQNGRKVFQNHTEQGLRNLQMFLVVGNWGIKRTARNLHTKQYRRVCVGTSMGVISDTYGLCTYTNTRVKLRRNDNFFTCTV